MGDDWGDLTAPEGRFLGMMLRRLRAGGGMIAGTYAEAVVAETLPGSTQPDLGAHPWDIDWEGHQIEVKLTRGTRWEVSERMARDSLRERRRRAHVYVLAAHTGTDHRTGWIFYVVPTEFLDGRTAKSIGVREVQQSFESVPLEGLADAVRAAAGMK